MRVFFHMSFRGDVELGCRIYREIENLGHKNTSNLFISKKAAQSFYFSSPKEQNEYYQKVFSNIARSDIIITEVSIHSLTVGSVIQKGLDSKIPVLALCREGQRKPFVDGIEYSEDRLLVVEYSNEDLSNKLKVGLEYLGAALSARFTMILSPEFVRHLDSIAQSQHISRSEYIRHLIQEDMKKRT